MVRIMYILPFLFITASYEITGSALRGMGRSAIPAVITVVGVVLFRVIWVYLIFPHFGSLLSLRNTESSFQKVAPSHFPLQNS